MFQTCSRPVDWFQVMGRVPESQRPLARAILALTKAEAPGDSWIHRTSVSVSVSVDLECDVGRPWWKRWAKTAPPRGTLYRRYGDMEVCWMGMADMHFLIISASQFSWCTMIPAPWLHQHQLGFISSWEHGYSNMGLESVRCQIFCVKGATSPYVQGKSRVRVEPEPHHRSWPIEGFLFWCSWILHGFFMDFPDLDANLLCRGSEATQESWRSNRQAAITILFCWGGKIVSHTCTCKCNQGWCSYKHWKPIPYLP